MGPFCVPKGLSGSVRVFYPRYRKEELIELLQRRMLKLSEVFPIRRVVLFGSWAQGKATAFSDIDLLVVYADPPRSDAYGIVRRVVGLPGIEPHVYAEQEAKMVGNVLDRMTKDSVLLYPNAGEVG